jgi:Gpi18-like mannosyltransferase
MWGQIDSIPIFFVLISIYLLLFTKKFLPSGFFFVLAIFVKPTALVFLPLYIIFFIRKYSLIYFLKTFLIANFIFFISFLPFLSNLSNLLLPYSIYSEKILAAQSLPFVTNGAFNFWVLITGFEGIKDTAPFIFGISYRLWGYLITGLIFSLATYYFFKKKDRVAALFSGLFLVALASFLFLTKMHERYSMLPLPFLLLAGLRNQRLIKWFVLLSLLSFLNLYHSWPVPKVPFFADFLNFPLVTTSVSLFQVVLFLYLFSRIMVSKNEH